jgi:2-oxoglutarate dehydrogenase complex dehydrogenase (E1) component-like enzyme
MGYEGQDFSDIAAGVSPAFVETLYAKFNAVPASVESGWRAFFDQDAAMAETTRRKVYDMLVADKMRVQGFHYPFPANGFVEKDGNGYRLVPAPWSPVI